MLINKKTLEYLAELSRIELEKKSEDKLLKDLQKILGHFEELKEVDMENVDPTRPPSTSSKAKSGAVAGGRAERDLSHAERGGTIEMNVFREDEPSVKRQMPAVQLTGQFPEKENGFLKVPAVFE